MISAVFDATTLLQAATSRRGPASACLALVDAGQVSLFSAPLLSTKSMTCCIGLLVKDVPALYRYERDPDDEPYINLAIAANASFIVSRDNDLLDLMEDDTFRTAYPGLAVVKPVTFLKHARTHVSNQSPQE